MKKFLLLIIFTTVLILTSCNLPNQVTETPTVQTTPEISYPAPVNTLQVDNGYPVITAEPNQDSSYPVPVSTEPPSNEDFSPIEMVSEFTLENPGRIKWCADQSCLSIIGYDYFKIVSYPEFNDLFSYNLIEGETFLDVAPDGKTYAITNNNEDIIIRNWETSTEQVIPTGIFFMNGEFSPDGKKILVTKQDEWGAPVFDVENAQLITTLTGFETAAPIYDVRFGQNNDYAIWIARGTIQVSEIVTNQIYPAIHHQDFITGFDLESSGTYLVTAAAESINNDYLPTIFIYDFKTGEVIHKFNTEKSIYALNFSPDGSNLAYSTGDSISILDINTQDIYTHFVSDNEAISQLSYSPDGKVLISIGEGINVKIFQLN